MSPTLPSALALTPDQIDRLKAVSNDPGFQALHTIFDNHGAELRCVGGCVRDALLGLPVGEIDLATTAVPEHGMAWLKEAGIAVKPTGLAHGTITAIVTGKPYEITTLRRDVKTDGRHAEVVFGTAWDDDAQRRDFTFNGLSCDVDGKLYDTVGGVSDLQAGRIRFIGDAGLRCREDYLRILRLFRFWARFGLQPIDRKTLDAVSQESDGLLQLSKQRVWMELRKLLSGPRADEAILSMRDYNILPALFDGQYIKPEQVKPFCAVEQAVLFTPEQDASTPLRRLASICAYRTQNGWTIDHVELRERFALSNREADYLRTLDRAGQAAVWWTSHLLAALSAFGREMVIDLCLMAVALGHDTLDDLQKILPDLRTVDIPVFPVTAMDLLARDFQPGPELGQALDKLKNYWWDTNCQATKDDCMELLDR